MPFTAVPILDRVSEKFDVDEATGCWLWNAGISDGGYAQVWFNGMTRAAHRVVYEQVVEPVPPELEVDHLCRVRHCINPDHLEPVTPKENTLRGDTPAARNAVKTHCVSGHEFNEVNTYVDKKGRRSCRPCMASHQRRYRRINPGRRNRNA